MSLGPIGVPRISLRFMLTQWVLGRARSVGAYPSVRRVFSKSNLTLGNKSALTSITYSDYKSILMAGDMLSNEPELTFTVVGERVVEGNRAERFQQDLLVEFCLP